MTPQHSPEDRTEALILALSAQAPPSYAPAWGLWLSAALGLGGLVAFMALAGIRSDLATAWSGVMVPLKTLLPLVVAVLALPLVLASLRPGRVWRAGALVLPLGLALGLVVWRLAQGGGGAEWLGQTAMICLVSITSMGLVPLLLGLWLLRGGAPLRPGITGALWGLVVGGAITAGYALHCTEDSPLFFVTWYGLAMVITAGIGALGGRALLRW